jgi:hypothetical protein
MAGQHRYELEDPSTGAGTVCLDAPRSDRASGQPFPVNTTCDECGRRLRVGCWVRPAPHDGGTGFLCCPCWWERAWVA